MKAENIVRGRRRRGRRSPAEATIRAGEAGRNWSWKRGNFSVLDQHHLVSHRALEPPGGFQAMYGTYMCTGDR